MNKSVLACLTLAFALNGCAPLHPAGSAAQAGDPGSSKPGCDLSSLDEARFLQGPPIPEANLRRDFDGWLSGMAALNPDLSIRTDAEGMKREAEQIRAAITHPMTQREAWALFARINPYLRDGHSGLMMPDYKSAAKAHLEAGGHLIPLEVRFASDGSLRVIDSPGSKDSALPGNRILSINGHAVDEIVEYILAIVPGETLAFRRASAGRRFAAFYWLLYGDTGRYCIGFADQGGGEVRIALDGMAALPVSLQPAPAGGDLYQKRVFDGDIGYMRVASFAYEQRAVLADFAREAFADFKNRGVRALIVDVRDNGGGDDPLWQENLMNHVTTTPYAQLSRYVLRITERNADPGDVIGAVQRSEYTKRFTPAALDPIRFDGPVYILGGPYSYSATIQFMVAAQDFGIAKIAGEETAALSCQTGQVNRIAMPLTGLDAFTPIIAYTRPSGRGCERGVIPDVEVAIDEVSPEGTLDALVAKIRVLQENAARKQ
jgi:hypothetical protein